MQVPLAIEHVVSFELDRHVLDAEEAHRVVDVSQDVLVPFGLAHNGVRAHRHHRQG